MDTAMNTQIDVKGGNAVLDHGRCIQRAVEGRDLSACDVVVFKNFAEAMYSIGNNIEHLESLIKDADVAGPVFIPINGVRNHTRQDALRWIAIEILACLPDTEPQVIGHLLNKSTLYSDVLEIALRSKHANSTKIVQRCMDSAKEFNSYPLGYISDEDITDIYDPRGKFDILRSKFITYDSTLINLAYLLGDASLLIDTFDTKLYDEDALSFLQESGWLLQKMSEKNKFKGPSDKDWQFYRVVMDIYLNVTAPSKKKQAEKLAKKVAPLP